MQSESIQTYRNPSFRVITTASRKLAGKVEKGMDFWNASIFSVVRRGEMMPPQQWLSATYLSSIPCVRKSRGSTDPSEGPTSITLEGSSTTDLLGQFS